MNQDLLLNKYLNRFYELREDILEKWKKSISWPQPDDEPYLITELESLKMKIITLLDPILPAENIHRRWMEELSQPEDFSKSQFYYQNRYRWLLGRLDGLREDFEQGMLGELSWQIEASITAAYSDQASQLLAEVKKNDFNHIPAAAIAGAILEQGLRIICKNQEITISEDNENINKLKTKLKDYFDDIDLERIEPWRKIRNNVAHGHFDQVSKEEVEEMLIGLSDFFDKHLSTNETTAPASS